MLVFGDDGSDVGHHLARLGAHRVPQVGSIIAHREQICSFVGVVVVVVVIVVASGGRVAWMHAQHLHRVIHHRLQGEEVKSSGN